MSIVYFLGAGATKAVAPDSPLGNELIPLIMENVDLLNRFPSEVKKIKEFINTTFHDTKHYPGIEDILSYLDFNINEKVALTSKYNFEDLINLKNTLIKIIGKMLEEYLNKLDNTTTDIFAKKITNYDTVISTNYDIVIDNALLTQKKIIEYGVRYRKNIFPTPISDGRNGIRATGCDAKLPISPSDSKIMLLKLHGSLNWLYCPKCDEYDITVGEKGAVKYVEENLLCYNHYCTSKYQYLIVTPTYFKEYENRIIKTIWKQARTSIANADKIVFIGYSLPEADKEIRCMILNGLNDSKIKPGIIVVGKKNSNSLTKERYMRLFGEVDYRPIGFVDYVNTKM